MVQYAYVTPPPGPVRSLPRTSLLKFLICKFVKSYPDAGEIRQIVETSAVKVRFFSTVQATKIPVIAKENLAKGNRGGKKILFRLK